MMKNSIRFARRIATIQPSFIREILKAAGNEAVISFAGGLPNQDYFPNEALAEISAKLMKQQPYEMLQYGQSEGELALRQSISNRYRERHQLDVPVDNIIITSGSQQGFDLIAKVLLDKGDAVVIESPGYLGAIQSLSFYQPRFLPVTMNADGMDTQKLEWALAENPKLVYTVPSFQNPTGFSYSEQTRRTMAGLIRGRGCLLVEDDPYGDIRFEGETTTSFYNLLPEQTILLGSFSKTIAPGLRTGWIVAPEAMTGRLLIAKQAVDLHSNRLSQHTIHDFINDHRFEPHLHRLCEAYHRRYKLMGERIDQLFGNAVKRSSPRGGMFVWLEFQDCVDTMKLFELAAAQGVVFVPGAPFYIDQTTRSTARLNFSACDPREIETGLERLYRAFESYPVV